MNVPYLLFLNEVCILARVFESLWLLWYGLYIIYVLVLALVPSTTTTSTRLHTSRIFIFILLSKKLSNNNNRHLYTLHFTLYSISTYIPMYIDRSTFDFWAVTFGVLGGTLWEGTLKLLANYSNSDEIIIIIRSN